MSNIYQQKPRVFIKFSKDICIFEEEMIIENLFPVRDGDRKKTIRFAKKRITYQYPRQKEFQQLELN